MSAPGRTWGNYRALFGNADYVRVFSAGAGSVAGQAIAGIALTWIVAVRTGSALAVGEVGAAAVVAAIAFTVFAGSLVDRYDPRRLMVASDLARAATMLVAVVDLAYVGFDLGVLIVVSGLVSAFGTPFNPAENAIIPRLVDSGSVANANGLVASSRSAVRFVGSAVAGALIFTVGPVVGLLANVGTYVVSAALLYGVRTPPAARPPAGPTIRGYLKEVAEGFRWLRRASGFLQLTLSALVFNFCSTLISTFLVFYATDVLHGSALTFSLLLAAEVAGTGIGALLVGPLGAARYAGRAWTIPYGAVSGLCVVAFVVVGGEPVAFAMLFALGLLGGFAGTAWLTAAQRLVPSAMLGRYFGIDNLGSIAILPAAQLGGAVLIELWGLRPAYLVVGAVWVAAGLLFLLPKALRELGVSDEATSAGSQPP